MEFGFMAKRRRNNKVCDVGAAASDSEARIGGIGGVGGEVQSGVDERNEVKKKKKP